MTFYTGLESIRCPVCGLVQFCTLSTICKRCRRSLGIRYATLNLSRKNLEKDNGSEEFTRAFGRMLRGMRLERKLTQAEFALRLHTSRSQLSRLETGRDSPSFSMLIRAARAFYRPRDPSPTCSFEISFKVLIGNVPSLAHRPLDSLLQPFLSMKFLSFAVDQEVSRGWTHCGSEENLTGKSRQGQNPEEILD